jgi:ABC-2 type transport system permease protein
VISALTFLLWRSFLNRTRARLKRLKQPKYLIGAIFGLLYLYGYLFQFLFSSRRGTTPFAGLGDIVESIGALVLLVIVLSAWLFPHQRAALVFTEAEIAFLYPAPLYRRTLIHYKLLKSQIAILITVLLITLVTGRLFSAGDAWMRVAGWWVILSTLNLHFLGASFARTMLLDRGITNRIQRVVVLLGLGALAVFTAFWARQNLPMPAFDNAADFAAWRDYLQQLFATPPLTYLLAPFRFVMQPYLAANAVEFAKAFGVALAIIAIHYAWVMRANVAFEEASLELSRRVAEKFAAAREGRAFEVKPTKGRRAPFRLAPRGLPQIAFLWKNLVGAHATFRPRTVLFVLLPFVVMAVFIGMAETRRGSVLIGTAAMLAFMFFIWGLLIGPQVVRCDLRKDLPFMDVLKQFPLRGWQVVAGELLAPTVILTVVQWLLLALGSALLTGAGESLPIPRVPFTWMVAAAIVAPFWNALTLLIPNAAVLCFPAWFQTRPDAPQGFEVAGQRLLLFLGQLVLLAVTVLPAALAFTAGFFLLHVAGMVSLAPLAGGLCAVTVLTAEAALGIWLTGKLYDRFDLAGEND